MANTYLSNTYASAAVNAILAASTTFYMSLHSGSPGITGANEILGTLMTGYSSGGYVGYRQPITFNAAVNGVQTQAAADSPVTFVLTAGWTPGPVPYFGLWTTADDSGANIYLCGGPTSGLGATIPASASVEFATGGVVISVQG